MTFRDAAWHLQPTSEKRPAFHNNRSDMEGKIAVENAELTLKMKEIIGTVANRRSDLGLYPQYWWSKEYTINKRKIVLLEIHHLEEVMCIATTVRKRKQSAWTKWESAKDRAATWSKLKHIESPKLSFLIKAAYEILPTPVNLQAWG